MIRAEAVKRAAKDRWPSLLPVLGIDAAFLSAKGGPCPICGAGKDRYRFDNKDGDGTWICNHCGAGDGISLVQKVNHWTFKETLEAIDRHVGSAPMAVAPKPIDPDWVRDEMRRISRYRRPVECVAATANWWRARVGSIPALTDVWGVERLRYQDGKDGVRSHHPGMIAVVRDGAGAPVNMHCTWLTPEGTKAAVPKPRKVMPINLPDGSAVRLAPYTDVLGIAEGIETAVAATILTGIPCWASLNSTLMRKWKPPESVHVVIFADNDEEKQGKRAGQEAAQALAGRLLMQGSNVEIRVPPIVGDWNDVLNMKLGGAA